MGSECCAAQSVEITARGKNFSVISLSSECKIDGTVERNDLSRYKSFATAFRATK